MKRIVAISFLLVIFLNHLGYYLLCSYQQYKIREKMEHALLASIPESEMQVIIAEENKITWEKYGKEFYLNNSMYDVIRMKEKDGKTYIYCLNDKKEKQLLNHLVKIMKAGNNCKNRSGKNTVKYQTAEYEAPVRETTSCVLHFLKPQYACFTSALHSSVKEILIPPPKA